MRRVVGREHLVDQVLALVDRGESVALHGPAGVGKSALLDRLERTARDRGPVELVRVSGDPEDQSLPYAALHDLVTQAPPSLAEALGARERELVFSGLVGASLADEARTELAAAVRHLLEKWAGRAPVLLLLDDVVLLDPESSGVIGYARRRLAGRFALVATIGPPPAGVVESDIETGGLHHLEIPPLGEGDLVDLLRAHGLDADMAHRVHVESGGMPGTALVLAGALGPRPGLLGEPAPLPGGVRRVLADRLDVVPDEVRHTLGTAALMHRPSVRTLERAGLVAAAEHVRRAVAAGLVVERDGVVRFTPSSLREVVVEATPPLERAELHRALAVAAPDRPDRARHLALAEARPDGGLALELAGAAVEATDAGARGLGAELYLLAAERAPLELADRRAGWLAGAVEAAAPGNHRELVRRALSSFWDAAPSPAEAVRVRLAIPELARGGSGLLDEVLAAALNDAADDDRLVARVLLQRARVALGESRPVASARDAEQAVQLLERLGDDDELALGLTTLAGARRWLGGDHQACLERAVALAGPAPSGLVHISPAYMAARFAFYDDRLDEAWTAFKGLLAQVDRGAGADEVHVLRCLVEVGTRRGRCREALEHAARASRLVEEFGLDPQTAWFISGLAELAGGDLGRARRLAERGVEAAERMGDTRYLIRHLGLLGQAMLRSGEAAGACVVLERIRAVERERGFSDPTVNRWHADLVSGLVQTGRLDEARVTLDEVRAELLDADRTRGVRATLDRGEAQLRVAEGSYDEAERLLAAAEEATTELGMPIERGRVLLVRAHLERRRRRVAASRAAVAAALEVLSAAGADSWVVQVRDGGLAPLAQPPADTPPGGGLALLNETEARIAREVATGASNREIAARTYLSVKTVEATLTRVYRKLDVRSRTQLAALLRPPPDPS